MRYLQEVSELDQIIFEEEVSYLSVMTKLLKDSGCLQITLIPESLTNQDLKSFKWTLTKLSEKEV